MYHCAMMIHSCLRCMVSVLQNTADGDMVEKEPRTRQCTPSAVLSVMQAAVLQQRGQQQVNIAAVSPQKRERGGRAGGHCVVYQEQHCCWR